MSGRRVKRQRKAARSAQESRPAPAPAVGLSMPQRYEELHYRGDVTSSEQARPGALLGHDEMGRPYEVLDAEFDATTGRTTVQLQYASPDNILAARASAGIR